MNCKQGDLAFVARMTAPDIAPHLGRVVRCLSLASDISWITEPELEPGRAVYDGALQPIRDNDCEDETLAWAGRPEAVPA